MPLLNIFRNPEDKFIKIRQKDYDELQNLLMVTNHFANELQSKELMYTALFESFQRLVLDVFSAKDCLDLVLHATLEEVKRTLGLTQTWLVKIKYMDGVLTGVYSDSVGRNDHDMPIGANINVESVLPTYLPHLKNNQIIVLQMDNNNTPDKTFFTMWKIKTLTIVPIKSDKNLWGGIGLVSHDKKRIWLDDEKAYMKMLMYLVNSYISSIDMHEHIKQHTYILNKLSNTINIYTWRKGADGAYTYIDPNWGKLFYPGLYDNTRLLGETDMTAITKFRSIEGNEHSFGQLCVGTDVICREQRKLGHFIELGMINGKPLHLHVVKLPEYDNEGNYTGILGIGHDISFIEPLKMDNIVRHLIEDGKLKIIQVEDMPYIRVYEFLDNDIAKYHLWSWYTYTKLEVLT
jgi:hypothetical protein